MLPSSRMRSCVVGLNRHSHTRKLRKRAVIPGFKMATNPTLSCRLTSQHDLMHVTLEQNTGCSHWCHGDVEDDVQLDVKLEAAPEAEAVP